MGRMTPNWDDIPDGGGSREPLPEGQYLVEVESFDEYQTRAGALSYKAVYRVVEPAEHAGRLLWEYHNIGTDDDPQAQDPQTWQTAIGTRTLKALGRAAISSNGALPTDMDTFAAAVRGQRFIQTVGRRIGKDRDGNDRPENTLLRKMRHSETPAPSAPTGSRRISGGSDAIVSPYTGDFVPRSDLGRSLR